MPDRDEKKKWYILDGHALSTLLVVLLAILFYVGLTNFGVISGRVKMFLGVISPFIAGFCIAYLLNTPVCFFARKVYKDVRFKWVLSIVTVYLIALAVIVILLNMVLPQVAQGVVDLAGNIDTYTRQLNQFVWRIEEYFHLEGEGFEELIGYLQDFTKGLMELLTQSLPRLLEAGVAIGSGVVTGVTALIASIYMLAGKARLVPQLKKMLYALFPKRRADKFLEVLSHANQVFVGFINGKIIDSAIIGVLCFILCVIVRIPYSMLMSVVIGVTNVIPFFGPIIGAVPCLMILVLVDPLAALRFLVMVVALQQFDGNILGPKILGDSTGLSAIWVLVSIIVGGGLFGFPGMILGVPTFAVLYDLMRQWVNKRLAAKGLNGNGDPVTPASGQGEP
ncbi:MAG: AI-2E family transporter [Flavonifractor sp.]|nr:AI-2E family transporter [Flavonifractor sp.]